MTPLAVFADLRRLSRLTWDDTEATKALALLSSASGVVRGFCGWQINTITTTVTLDGPGGRLLALPCLNVTSVSDVSIVVGPDVKVVTDYFPSVSSGMLRRQRGWPSEFSSIRLTLTGGYDPIPDQIVAVVCSMVDRAVTVPVGISQEATGTVSRSYTSTSGSFSLSDAEKDALGPYRMSRAT